MDDEAMKAMARRIAEASRINGPLGLGPPDAYRAALAAIIETQELCAALVEDGFRCRTCDAIFVGSKGHPIPECERPNWDNLSPAQIAAAIRSGQQFRKDV